MFFKNKALKKQNFSKKLIDIYGQKAKKVL
jgi:hypothetical protein